MIQAAKDAKAILDGFGLIAAGKGRASPVDGSILPGIADSGGTEIENAIGSYSWCQPGVIRFPKGDLRQRHG